MDENLMIDNWRQLKLSGRNFYRLEKSLLVEHEYRHRFGHPSSYAYVQFECEPSETLSFESSAAWKESLSPDYVVALERAVCEGIVDGLIAASIYPYRGCSLTLCQIKWDDVSSSEAAFYLATKRAMAQLIESGSWKVKTKD
jgi:translation elongation factor EF-G